MPTNPHSNNNKKMDKNKNECMKGTLNCICPS